MTESRRSLSWKNDTHRWEAIVRRDPMADGIFYYSVRSTGVFCKPSCPSRLAKRVNVAFHDSREDAIAAGFRPCKRCRPDADLPHGSAEIVQACRMIEGSDEPPTLETLATAIGMSSFHFQRAFKKFTGLTPKAYSDAWRARRVRNLLPTSSSITEAIYESGFNSNGRFYDTAESMLGMKPESYRKGGKDEEIHFAIGESSLGLLLVAATEKGVCSISMGDDLEMLRRELQSRFSNAKIIPTNMGLESSLATIIAFIEGPTEEIHLPLDIRGTIFQQKVWKALREIPLGSTASYAEIAEKIGSPKSTRAIAGACAANPIALAIPCHRVIRADGELSGYRWGSGRKRQLLNRETQR